jgi:hypothetical protein
VLPLLLGLDHCNRFRPLFDKNTFKEEIYDTDGELINYLDSKVSRQYRSYLQTSKYITIAFWVSNLSFAVFCHKIGIIRKVLG